MSYLTTELDLHVPVRTFALNSFVKDAKKFNTLEPVYGRKPTSPMDVRLGFGGLELTNGGKGHVKQL